MRLLCLSLVSLALLAIRPETSAAQAQLDPKFWIGNMSIDDVARVGDRLYVAGGFTVLGPHTGAAVPLDPVTGQRSAQFPKFLGTDHSTISIRKILPDGAGGWYVGGQFASVDGQARSNLAHVASDGTLSAWNPGANGTVEDLELNGTTLYVAGWFTTLAGQPRNRLGAVSTATGAATSFNPNASAAVLDIERDGTTMYAGGMFTVMGGQLRTALAAVNTATGATLAWDASLGGGSQVNTIARNGATLYIGGGFSTVGVQTRNGFAALDAATAAVTAYNPGSAPNLYQLLVHGGTLYLAGYAMTLDGQGRQGVASIDLTSGSVTSWQPVTGGPAYGLTVLGGTVYVAGDFDYVKENLVDPDIIVRNNLAAFDAATGVPTSWDPVAEVWPSREVATDGLVIYAGGSFSTVNGVRRLGFGALDLNSGEALPWTPPSGMESVTSLHVEGTTLFVAGPFDTLLSPRSRLAAFDGTTGTLLPWKPAGNALGAGSIEAMVADAGTLFVGGGFFGTRNGLAAFDRATGALLGWNPNVPSAQVSALALNGGELIAGGQFSTVGGQSRPSLAAVDKVTAAPTSWSPAPSGAVLDLDVAGGTLYAVGEFTSIAGQSRLRIAAFDAATHALTAWNPGANSRVTAVEAAGGPVYVAGAFTTTGNPSVSRTMLAALDPATGSATAFDPALAPTNGALHSLLLDGARVFTSGFYVSIAGQPRTGLAALTDLGVAPVDAPQLAGPFASRIRVFPNPVRTRGTVEFDGPGAGGARGLSLVDVAGRRVRTLLDGGDGRAELDATGLPSGVYFVRADGAAGATPAKVIVTR